MKYAVAAALAILTNGAPSLAAGFCSVAGGVAYGDAPAVASAENRRAYWTVQTSYAHSLAMRLDNANDRFTIIRRVNSDASGSDCLYSGQYVRLATAGFSDYLIADSDINENVVKVGRDYGPPMYRGTGVFFIEKVGGSQGNIIRYGDVFRIRGVTGNLWLCMQCNATAQPNPWVQLTQRIDSASGWVFIH